MISSIRIKAFAKINIGLAIGDPFPDGYHPIASIFQAVSLYDELVIKLGTLKGGIIVEGDFDCSPEKTTVFKAAQLLKEQLGETRSLAIVVHKDIPAKAGMGGGSSDAAAVLVGLNLLLGKPLDKDLLLQIGRRVGADVPYFIAGKGTAMVSGIGEIIEPLSTRTDFRIVTVVPNVGISTPAAYASLDAKRKMVRHVHNSSRCSQAIYMMPELYGKACREWDFVNDFQSIVLEDFPELAHMPKALEAHGAVFTSLSGSGSCIYGIFEDEAMALQAAGSLKIPGCTRIMMLKPLETTCELG